MRIQTTLGSLILCLAVTGCTQLQNARFWPGGQTVDVTAPAIVLKQDCSKGERAAAEVLREHLAQRVGKPVPVLNTPVGAPRAGHIHVAIAPPECSDLGKEGPAYAIQSNGTFIVGHTESQPQADDENAATLLSAIYAFLENECGIHWVMPGKDGTVVPDAGALQLRIGKIHRIQTLPHVSVSCFPQVPETEIRDWLAKNRVVCDAVVTVNPQNGDAIATVFPIGIVDPKRDRMENNTGSSTVTVGPGIMNAFQTYWSLKTTGKRTQSWKKSLPDFCTAFGSAASDIDRYLSYWIQYAEAKLAPVLERMEKENRKNEYREIYLEAPEIYSGDAFRQASEFLHQALLSVDGDRENRLLERLIVDHEHAALTAGVCSVTAPMARVRRSTEQMLQEIKILHDMRCTGLPGHLPESEHVSFLENRAGDVTGLGFLSALDGRELVQRLPVIWYVADDGEEWENIGADHLRREGQKTIRTDMEWWNSGDGAQTNPRWVAIIQDIDRNLRDKKLYLGFWGITADVDVFVNGVNAGKHAPGMQENSSSLVRIDPQLETRKDEQIISLKVTGNGLSDPGLWRPLWLVAEENKTK